MPLSVMLAMRCTLIGRGHQAHDWIFGGKVSGQHLIFRNPAFVAARGVLRRLSIVGNLCGKKQGLDVQAVWLCVRWHPMHCNGKQLVLRMGFLLIISSFSVSRPPMGIVLVSLASASFELSGSWKTNSSVGFRLHMATFRVCVS